MTNDTDREKAREWWEKAEDTNAGIDPDDLEASLAASKERIIESLARFRAEAVVEGLRLAAEVCADMHYSECADTLRALADEREPKT